MIGESSRCVCCSSLKLLPLFLLQGVGTTVYVRAYVLTPDKSGLRLCLLAPAYLEDLETPIRNWCETAVVCALRSQRNLFHHIVITSVPSDLDLLLRMLSYAPRLAE